MIIQDSGQLLYALLQATRPSDVEAILRVMGDRPDLAVDEPFGDLGYQWHFVGDNPSNMSTINLASKPGRSLTERVTNAIDALLERARYAHQDAKAPGSPMAAAQQWFGRPPTTVNTGLYQLSDHKRDIMADLIQVVLAEGDESGKPTIDVLDRGIGLDPQEFNQTILSFHQGNKINKAYLAGAFGQGGSSTIAFSDYTLIVSRHMDGQITGFTLVKQKELGEGYKENAYVYLAVTLPNGDLTVPYIYSDTGIDIYPAVEQTDVKPRPLTNGTVVRHYGYQLGALDKPLSTSPGNLYHLLEYMLFDPVLPFQLVDMRKPEDIQHLIVVGSRNRLMGDQDDVDIRHHQPKFWIRPLSGEPPSLGVEYWVVFSSLKHNGHEPSQRARPNDLFLDPAHPILGTLNGQNHGELTNRILREAKLPQVAKHLVVHLDLSHISKRVRSQLLSSTREGFKDGGPLDEVTRVLKDHFRDDDRLQAIETELQNMLLGGDSGEDNAEVKLQITRLLKDVGLDYGDFGRLPVSENGERAQITRQSRTQRLLAAQPLDPLPYPQVSQFSIVSPHEVLRIRQGDSRLVKVETDADIEFDRQGDIQIRVEPDSLVDVAKGALIGGRIQWRLRPRTQSQPGQFGQVIVTLRLPDGNVLEDHIPYEVLPPREQGIRTQRGLVPNFEIQGVDPEESPDHFFRVWDYLDPAVDDLSLVSYKVVEVGSSIIVYYSKAFGPYRKRWDAIMQKQPELASQFVQNYEIWVGYYAIIQWQQRLVDETIDPSQVDEALLEKLYNRESALVAEVQAKQALEVADLQRRFTDLV